MIIKPPIDFRAVTQINDLLEGSSGLMRQDLERRIEAMRRSKATRKREALFDQHLWWSYRWAVVHGLRLPDEAGVANIDHLLIGRSLTFYAVDSRLLGNHVRVCASGRIERWSEIGRRFVPAPAIFEEIDRSLAAVQQHLQSCLPEKKRSRMVGKSIILVDGNKLEVEPGASADLRFTDAESFFASLAEPKQSWLAGLIEARRCVSVDGLQCLAESVARRHSFEEHDFAALQNAYAPARAVGA